MAVGLQQVYQRLDDLEQAVNRIDRDLTDDRSRIDRVVNLLDDVNSKLTTIIQRFPRLETKTQDSIRDVAKDVVDPVVKELNKLRRTGVIFEEKRKSLFVRFLAKFRKGGEEDAAAGDNAGVQDDRVLHSSAPIRPDVP